MARAGRVSDVVAGEWLADLAARSTHLALMVQDPFSVVDPLTVEVGGAYSRVMVSWLTSLRLLRNQGLLAWSGIPAGTQVVAIAGFDAGFNGAMSFSAPITPRFFPDGGGITIPAEDFFVGLDA